MLWFILLVLVLIFLPGLAVVLGIGVLALSTTLAVFFAVWGATIYAFILVDPHSSVWGVIIGFGVGIYVARRVVVAVSNKVFS